MVYGFSYEKEESFSVIKTSCIVSIYTFRTIPVGIACKIVPHSHHLVELAVLDRIRPQRFRQAAQAVYDHTVYPEAMPLEPVHALQVVRYRLKYGRYAVTGTQVSGTYSGDIPWGSSYEAAVDGNTLILTAANASGEVCTYEKETIPAEVISGAVEFRSSGEGASAGGWL